MTYEEAIEYNKNLRMYMKLSDKNQPCKFLEENYIALDMAIEALEQQPCEDAIDRAEVMRIVSISTASVNQVMAMIESLPSIQPKAKTGHWIEHPHEAGENWEYSKYECSECHVWEDDDSDYCPNCGAKMESEG